MATLAFAADLHLARGAWQNRPQIAGDAVFSLCQLTQWCAEHSADLVLGGDIFDTQRPSPDIVAHLQAAVAATRAAGCAVWFVQGNHDFHETHPWPEVCGARWLRGCELVGGLRLSGLDWTPAPALQSALQGVDSTADVLVAHQAWQQLQPGGAGDLAQVPANFHTVLTGDLHKRVSLTVEREAGTPLHVLSPGSTCLQAGDEPVDKWFVELTDGAFRWQPLVTRHLEDLEVASEAELLETFTPDLLAAVLDVGRRPAPIDKPIVRVRYPDTIDDAAAHIMAWAGDRVHVFLLPRACARVQPVLDTREFTTRFSLREALQRLLPDAEDMRLAQALIDAPENAETLLQAWISDAPADA